MGAPAVPAGTSDVHCVLVTPIFWPPNNLAGTSRFIFVDFNPCYRIVDLVRRPLLGNAPTLTSYATVLSMVIVA